MAGLVSLLRARINSEGPLPFSEFMRECLYHPELGYYRRAADPFGAQGDFYTAEQIQPVFGRLIGSITRQLLEPIANAQVVELGAGRAEMASFFVPFAYHPVDWLRERLPSSFSGLAFANEFFDALPVDVAKRRDGKFYQMAVDEERDGFVWREHGELSPEQQSYLSRYAPEGMGDLLMEIPLVARAEFARIASALERGFFLIIDYGYEASELRRFAHGTLMSYRRHVASEAVLSDPGKRDITAHICFTDLRSLAEAAGMRVVRDESLRAFLMRAGETDQFAGALEAPNERERLRLRLQLKSLLFGLGETFRVLLLEKGMG